KTIVEDMTVGGQRAYADETGFHIGDQGQPANAVANQIAQQSLSKSGMEVLVSTPKLEKSGPTATYTAGSLLIFWNPSPDVSFVWAFGGSRASATAAPGFGTVATGIGDQLPSVPPPVAEAVDTGGGGGSTTGELSSAPSSAGPVNGPNLPSAT